MKIDDQKSCEYQFSSILINLYRFSSIVIDFSSFISIAVKIIRDKKVAFFTIKVEEFKRNL
jgi:hypothetical protein